MSDEVNKMHGAVITPSDLAGAADDASVGTIDSSSTTMSSRPLDNIAWVQIVVVTTVLAFLPPLAFIMAFSGATLTTPLQLHH